MMTTKEKLWGAILVALLFFIGAFYVVPVYALPTYTVSYYIDGILTFQVFEIAEGNRLDGLYIPDESEIPTGKVFLGWESDGTDFSKDTPIIKNTRLDAKLTNASSEKITVSFFALEDLYKEIEYTYGSKPTLPDAVITGYDFLGWYTESELSNRYTEGYLTEDISVYGKMKKTVFTVTFLGRNDRKIAEVETEYGTSAVPPTRDVAEDGYSFVRWTGDFDNVTENLTIEGEYVLLRNIEYRDENGNEVTAPPQKVGYTFDGWKSEEQGDLTVFTPIYTKNHYKILLTEADGGAVTASATAAFGERVEISVSACIGYSYDGLTVKVGEVDVETDENAFIMPDGNVSVTANFLKQNDIVTVEKNQTAGAVTLIKYEISGKAYSVPEITVSEAQSSDLTLLKNRLEKLIGADGYVLFGFTLSGGEEGIKHFLRLTTKERYAEYRIAEISGDGVYLSDRTTEAEFCGKFPSATTLAVVAYKTVEGEATPPVTLAEADDEPLYIAIIALSAVAALFIVLFSIVLSGKNKPRGGKSESKKNSVKNKN